MSSIIRTGIRRYSQHVPSSQMAKTAKRENGVWNDFSHRSPSLKSHQTVRSTFLEGMPQDGPISRKTPKRKSAYESPMGIENAYFHAYNLLQKQAEKSVNELMKVENELAIEQDAEKKAQLYEEKIKLSVEAEKYNPEVVYNAKFTLNSVDYEQPVYRYYAEKTWDDYKEMLLMQRLETMSVIPDTMPTLEPKALVDVSFPHTSQETWVEPGVILPSTVTAKPPAFKILDFHPNAQDNLYTVLIVNPDTPDLAQDSFSTTLQYGLVNLPITAKEHFVNGKFLESGDYILKDYVPACPERNTQPNRSCIWVFRQNGEIALNKDISREFFDIREFAGNNNLTAIGAHFFRSIWDRSVEQIREQYGLPAGRVFHKFRSETLPEHVK